MIILDTNVIAELLRATPAPAVEAWLAGQDGADIYLTVISEAELRYGVAIMADGKRRKMLAEAVDGIPQVDFHGRILPFDSAVAGECARIGAERGGAADQRVRRPDRRHRPCARRGRRNAQCPGFRGMRDRGDQPVD